MQIMTGKKYFDAPDIRNLHTLLDYAGKRYSERNAVCFRETVKDKIQTVTYRQLLEDVNILRQGLDAAGIQRARIGVVGDNSYGWMLAYLAAVTAGHVIVPLDRLLRGEELATLIERGEVEALFLDASIVPELMPHIAKIKSCKLWLTMLEKRFRESDKIEMAGRQLSEAGARLMRMDDIMRLGRERVERGEQSLFVQKEDEEMLALLFTSGTTHDAKAVMLSHKALAADVRALLETVCFKDPLKTLSILPLHHTFENTCGFLTVLAIGGCIHICDGLRYIAQNIQEYKVDMVIGVPTLFEMIYRKIVQKIEKEGKQKTFRFGVLLTRFLRFFGIDIRRKVFKEVLEGLGGNLYIAISGAAALDAEIVRFFYDIGIEILQGYGMTETAPVVCGCNTQLFMPGTVGQPLSGVVMAIDNERDGVPGEILVKGDMLMLGYYQDEESTKEALDEEGWLHSGDIGMIDPKNACLKITGRTKSMIVLPSGKKVFPEELESLLNQNKYIRDSLVFGQEDANGDIVLTAKIVLDEQSIEDDMETGAKPEFIRKTIEGYISSINKILPSFKGIRSYAYSFRDMVKTTTMKVRRGVETEQIRKLIAASKLSWKELTGQNLDLLDEEAPKKDGGDHPAKA